MYQVNLLNSNYYPVRQVKVTSFKSYALYLKDKLTRQGKLAGVIQY